MESHLLCFVAFLLLAVGAVSHAALSSEVYWHTVLPNTPMPKAVREMLRTDLEKEKGTSVNVGKGGVVVVDNNFKKYIKNKFKNYGGAAGQLHENPNVTLYILEKDLHEGSKMNLQFSSSTKRATFLPRQLADAIPFTSDKLADVMKKFSVEPQSLVAEEMKQTIKDCEEPAQEGEEKYCATSLESMVDFSVSKLGKQVLPISTEVDKEETVWQQYTIGAGVKTMGGEKSIVCHSQTYAYAVFYCHEIHPTKAYKVPLVGADGTKATAVAVCHQDTSKWNPEHLAFQVLKVKPGTVPVCHFLSEGQIVWTSN